MNPAACPHLLNPCVLLLVAAVVVGSLLNFVHISLLLVLMPICACGQEGDITVDDLGIESDHVEWLEIISFANEQSNMVAEVK